MNRTARDNRPYVPRLEKIEVSQKNIKLKWAAAILFFVVGAATLAFSLNDFLSQEPGWQEIKADSSYADSCANEFVLMYNLGAGDTSATQESKDLKALYADAARKGFQLFHGTAAYEGISNVFQLNAHPNEWVTVEPALYHALEQIAVSGSRQFFMAPAALEYKSLFLSQEDAQAEQLDPRKNPELQQWLAQLGTYASDPNHISLELTGENRVMLKVSPEYLAFARENEIGTLADFGWMRNAFLADYLAEALAAGGYTSGFLTSFDGFTRNLTEGDAFGFNLFDRKDGIISAPGSMKYTGPMSIVFLRSYPMTAQDRWLCYGYENGDTVSLHLNPETCLPMTAEDNLVSYSRELGCAQVLLAASRTFIAPELDMAALTQMKAGGIYSIWPEGTVLRHNDPDVSLELAEGNTRYSFALK